MEQKRCPCPCAEIECDEMFCSKRNVNKHAKDQHDEVQWPRPLAEVEECCLSVVVSVKWVLLDIDALDHDKPTLAGSCVFAMISSSLSSSSVKLVSLVRSLIRSCTGCDGFDGEGKEDHDSIPSRSRAKIRAGSSKFVSGLR